MKFKIGFFLLLGAFSCFAQSCQKKSTVDGGDSSTAPVLTPQESLKHFKLADQGLEIKLVASEPLIHAPVAIKFDAKGRIWAVEMKAFMRDMNGADNDSLPMGDIVILSDQNQDGVMDHRKVFMDSLVFPRAISFYEDGLLVAEPPKLLFVEILHDSAGTVTVIDSSYAVGGNVEHQPNGLLHGLDNWIYSANSTKRYRRIDGEWLVQRTHYRGQWGITQDNYGRLFYNNNHTNLLGDYFLPSLGAWNPNQKSVSGFNEVIVSDNRVYPIHPTPGVNRGYRAGVLDDSLRLNHFTAAASPLIYRGGGLGAKYEGNAFVAEPAGNLVKRNILWSEGYHVLGKQAYHGKEFLASDDERFRPVGLKTGPDGALYIVDMYRGIIEYKAYLTPYLRKQIEKRDLQYPLNRGRIYKIVPKDTTLSYVDLSSKSATELVSLLDHSNSWVRKTAQRLLVDGKMVRVEDQLRQQIKNDTFSLIGQIHAFWTLEELGKLQRSDIQWFLESDQIKLQQQAIAAAVSRMDNHNAEYWLKRAGLLFERNDKQLAPYVAFLAASGARFIPQQANDLLLKLAHKYENSPYVSDAVISGLHGNEKIFLQQFKQSASDTASVFYHHLNEVITNMKKRKKTAKMKKKMEVMFSQGKQLYMNYCQSCHGADGNGIKFVAPPLNGSKWVTGDKNRAIAIVLHGLTGPIKVMGKIYKPPEVAHLMPGFAKQFSDKEVAQIISYIRNAWANTADPVSAEDVKKVRQTHKDRQQPFTTDELKQLE